MKPAVVFDVDGTLCDVSSVRHFVIPTDGSRKKNFHAFHDAATGCPPHQWVVDLTHDFRARGFTVIVVTARDAVWAVPTLWWLLLNDVAFDVVFHRPAGDRRKDFDVKADILAHIRANGFDVQHAVDDNPNVIALWNQHGIPTTIVPGWDHNA